MTRATAPTVVGQIDPAIIAAREDKAAVNRDKRNAQKRKDAVRARARVQADPDKKAVHNAQHAVQEKQRRLALSADRADAARAKNAERERARRAAIRAEKLALTGPPPPPLTDREKKDRRNAKLRAARGEVNMVAPRVTSAVYGTVAGAHVVASVRREEPYVAGIRAYIDVSVILAAIPRPVARDVIAILSREFA